MRRLRSAMAGILLLAALLAGAAGTATAAPAGHAAPAQTCPVPQHRCYGF